MKRVVISLLLLISLTACNNRIDNEEHINVKKESTNSSSSKALLNSGSGQSNSRDKSTINAKQEPNQIDRSTIAANDFWEHVYQDNRFLCPFDDFIINIYERQDTTDDFATWYRKNPDDTYVDLGNLNYQVLSTPSWFELFEESGRGTETFNSWIHRVYDVQYSQLNFEEWYEDNPTPENISIYP
ncbi:hypothetical protein [Candidatus Enterococcus ferrettii]|uniref:Lipoprotein n=1 Tax=Candidatus Enterococcus ferrettii TaxID=2815324 RepID=A0ABV0ENB1_9ENTE|nr:hypothetical protein [Enterococcus sp. 665A]MBO1338230.1 hypothetical protein [Enterococcus sp. 665A]